MVHNPFISGLNDTACILALPGFAHLLAGMHEGFATDLLAKLWSGGIFTHWVTSTNFLKESPFIPKVSGLTWRELHESGAEISNICRPFWQCLQAIYRSVQLLGDHGDFMLIDAHSHIDKYVEELDLALAEINDHRIFTLAVSIDPESFERSKQIANQSDFVVPTFGVHPWEAPRFSNEPGFLDELIAETPIIGEIGLDFHFIEDSSLYPKQRMVFEHFLGAAASQEKIVNLHTKGAEKEVVEKLEEYKIPLSIVHWYSGPIEFIERYLATGSYFTIGVELLCSEHIRTVLEAVPDERLLTETDNPGGYRWLTEQVGMPGVIRKVVAEIAEFKGITEEELITLVSSNFEKFIADVDIVGHKWADLRKNGSIAT